MNKTIIAFLFLVGASLLAADSPESPAPSTDRVGFPKDYRKTYQVLRVVNKPDKKQVVTVYGNDAAASVKNPAGLPYPYGSVIVMETSHASLDAQGNPTKNEAGKFTASEAVGLHVMRREKGFGEAYGKGRSGEWEYVEYKPDGSYITSPAKSASCSECHVKAGASRDYVYQARLGAMIDAK